MSEDITPAELEELEQLISVFLEELPTCDECGCPATRGFPHSPGGQCESAYHTRLHTLVDAIPKLLGMAKRAMEVQAYNRSYHVALRAALETRDEAKSKLAAAEDRARKAEADLAAHVDAVRALNLECDTERAARMKAEALVEAATRFEFFGTVHASAIAHASAERNLSSQNWSVWTDMLTSCPPERQNMTMTAAIAAARKLAGKGE
jgi:hypothetical protein